MCPVICKPLEILDLLNQHLVGSMNINKLKSKETAKDWEEVKETPGKSYHLLRINISFLNL